MAILSIKRKRATGVFQSAGLSRRDDANRLTVSGIWLRLPHYLGLSPSWTAVPCLEEASAAFSAPGPLMPAVKARQPEKPSASGEHAIQPPDSRTVQAAGIVIEVRDNGQEPDKNSKYRDYSSH